MRPNIQGYSNSVVYVGDDWTPETATTGLFSSMRRWGSGGVDITVESTHGAVLSVNANLGNSIYAGNKMQSSALSALPCIRT